MRLVLFVFMSIALTGCVPSSKSMPTKTNKTVERNTPISTPTKEPVITSIGDVLFPSSLQYPEWTSLGQGAWLREYVITEAEQIKEIIAVVRFDKRSWKLQLVNTPENPKPVQAWQKDLNAAVIVNGAYFIEENFKPAGYMRIAGESFGTQRLPYVGSLVLEPTLQLFYAAYGKFPALESATTMVTSYPMLVWQGEKLTTGKSIQTSRRTAIASTATDEILLLATQRFSLSLDELATWMITSDLQIVDALNLDGGGSTGMSVRSDQISYDITGFDEVPSVLYSVQS